MKNDESLIMKSWPKWKQEICGIKIKIPTFKELEYLLNRLSYTKFIKDTNEYHPENNVLEHSIQAFNIACKETDSSDTCLRLAALLHDIGKITDHKDHAEPGYKIIKNYVSEKTAWLVLNHMRIKYYLNGNMKKSGKIKDLENHPYFKDLIRLHRWDLMGRNNVLTLFDKDVIIIKVLEII